MSVINICNKAIEILFYILFFLVPLIFLPVNFELFEFNKMILTYAITVLIAGFWALKMVLQGEIRIQKTPLDIPILLFLASQIISTIVSIDVHTSVWGYYSRSNGGLASIFSYIFLYYAFVSNFPSTKVVRLLLVMLSSGTLVATYGILEHFGIDKDYWVQDVQNRVFSTLGQPNWLAAYLSILIPIAIAGVITRDTSNVTRKNVLLVTCYLLLVTLFYITLLFTKSRSGFLGLAVGLAFFLLMAKDISHYWKLVVLVLIGSITFIVGSPFEQLNRFTLQGFQRPTTNDQPFGFAQGERLTTKPQGPALETGGTESGEIRKIVWKGAIDIARHYPLFGSGVETFAYSYYQFRPVEHNRTSEWDFLYNKAHNEYLNYLANTGFVGLGTYLLMIGMFLWIVLAKYAKFSLNSRKIHVFREDHELASQQNFLLTLALIAGYISILVSNFFGFSVVVINIFFFLIPAFVFVLMNQLNPKETFVLQLPSKIVRITNFLIVLILFSTFYLLFSIFMVWEADRNFATAKNLDRSGEFVQAYPFLVSAIQKRSGEPLFSEELAINTSNLAIAALETNDATLSSELIKEAVRQSDFTVKKGPNNPNFWRTRVRVFYTLAQIDEKYNEDAVEAAKRAVELSPTDPKIGYNYGLLLGQTGRLAEAIKELERTVALKPDYRDPIYALGLFYHEKATEQKGIVNQEYLTKAIAQMEAVLNLASEDAEAKEKLKEWKGSP